jgi:hypothetical protein
VQKLPPEVMLHADAGKIGVGAGVGAVTALALLQHVHALPPGHAPGHWQVLQEPPPPLAPVQPLEHVCGKSKLIAVDEHDGNDDGEYTQLPTVETSHVAVPHNEKSVP